MVERPHAPAVSGNDRACDGQAEARARRPADRVRAGFDSVARDSRRRAPGPRPRGVTPVETLEDLLLGARGQARAVIPHPDPCLLYTSDAADDLLCVDLGGR